MLIHPSVIEAWTAVAYKHDARGLTTFKELLDVRGVVKFHGDAIHCLQLSQPVTRPVSLEQIRKEQEIHNNWKDWRKNWRKEFLTKVESWADPNNRDDQDFVRYYRDKFSREEREWL